MTTYEGVPSLSTFVAMKLANRISKARSKQSNNAMNRARTMLQTAISLVAQLAGFSLLTWAGFTWNMTAGLIVAGLSCFVFAWLTNSSATETAMPDSRTPQVDPMASRR